MEKKLKNCPKCSNAVDVSLVQCPFCNTVFSTKDIKSVSVMQIDSFATLHTPIKGKLSGRLTPIGKVGIILGLLIVLISVLQIFLSTKNSARAEEIFLLMLVGVGFVIASFLWARK